RPTGKIVEISGDVPVGMHMALRQFTDAISTRIWESVGRANWRKFEDARAHARNLDLQSASEWRAYSKSGKKPADIPGHPYTIYAQAGWTNWGDWLGTGRVRVEDWRPFKEARSFARRLRLKSGGEWLEYCKSGKKPADIPTYPDQT